MTANPVDTLDGQLQGKLAACREIISGFGGVVIAFSGGVDSTLLLALAVETLGADKALAATGVSPLVPSRERRAVRRIARHVGAELVEIETDEMSDPAFTANPPQRCFHCKRELFGRLRELADRRSLACLASGANADDTGDYRPGLRAGRTLGVRYPLMEAELTKEDIRRASRAMHLPTWNKPSLACLASRVPYGQPITAEKLARIDRSEDALIDMGFSQCRVRDHGPLARVEVTAAQIALAVKLRAAIAAALKEAGYTYVTVDLEGFRSGSMNEVLPEM